jgi:hypothetical protein
MTRIKQKNQGERTPLMCLDYTQAENELTEGYIAIYQSQLFNQLRIQPEQDVKINRMGWLASTPTPKYVEYQSPQSNDGQSAQPGLACMLLM